jgi:hypothetical protein
MFVLFLEAAWAALSHAAEVKLANLPAKPPEVWSAHLIHKAD